MANDEMLTLEQLKGMIAEGAEAKVQEQLAALEAKHSEAIEQAKAEARAEAETMLQEKMDRELAELRRPQVEAEPVKELAWDEVIRSSGEDDKPHLRGTAGIAADLVYMEYVARGGDRSKCRLFNHPGIRKALTTGGSGTGAEWVPDSFSDQFVADVSAALKLPAAFQSYRMPTKSMTIPAEGDWATVYLVAENTSFATTLTDGLTADVTRELVFDAVRLAAATYVSFEWDQDVAPIAARNLRDKLVRSVARGIEDAILNGDDGDTHMDADVTTATDRRAAWDGLRRKALTDGDGNVDLSGGLDADGLVEMIGNMGEYGMDVDNLVWIVGPQVRAQLLLLSDANNNQVVTTVDKYGPAASVLSGEVGKLFGIPVIASPVMREDLGPSGYYEESYGGAGENAYGCILLTWRPAYGIGDREDLTLEVERRAMSQATGLVAVWRGDFAHAHGTELTTVMGYGIPIVTV